MSLLSVVIPAYNEGAMIHKTAEVVSSLLKTILSMKLFL